MISNHYGQSTSFYPLGSNPGVGYQPAMKPSFGDYRPAPNSVVARDFVEGFSYFQGPSGFVTQAVLQHAGNRPLIGDPLHDRMTLLAREVLGRPEMNHLLDAINHGGCEDGLISLGDAHNVAEHFELQEASIMQDGPRRYDGAMQRHRIDNGYGESWAAHRPQVFDRHVPEQPVIGGMYASSYGGGMHPQGAELTQHFKHTTDADLAMELGNNFDYFKPNTDGGPTITQASLREVAGRPLTGNPVDDRMTVLAREILSRPKLNRELDSDHDSDKPDGIIGRGTTDRVSNRVTASVSASS